MGEQLIPAGAVQYFARKKAPEGWLVADGSEVSRSQYSDLFAAIRVDFGMGDGIDTFRIPDLRGEFIRCLDAGRGVDSGRSIGSTQIATQVLVDNDANAVVGAIDWTNNDLSALGYEPASVAKVSLHYNSATSGAQSYESQFARSIRPRNVALLACIKY